MRGADGASIPPEHLVRALLLMILHSTPRGERRS